MFSGICNFLRRRKEVPHQQPATPRIGAYFNELKRSGDNLRSFLLFDQRYFLPDDILAKVDRISMAIRLRSGRLFSIIGLSNLLLPCRRVCLCGVHVKRSSFGT